ncbi:energy transducer TonB [Maribellus sp. YY47]|uniref:energy transducer TonB n=1 Tax=Maribellus sp. YY47 TaxID=2929486 RepID=UPI0020018775|nr:energy transducer TonB [Maribellus sp. YY47]MCK3686065.1 energy transducer TonB [Maribellus sp. YY47]
MKTSLFFILMCFVATFAVQAQKTDKNKDKVFTEVDEQPVYPGGEEALFKFISDNVKYPVKAQEKGIQGKVYVEFIIDKTGTVTQAKISRSVDTDLDNESLRVVKLLKKWTPGKVEGKPVNVKYTLPISFALS